MRIAYGAFRLIFNEKHVSENQEKQAWLPEGCTVLQNDNGTAPGCAFQAENGCTVIMLPGPPSELAPMLENYAVPYLKKSVNSVIVSHNVHIYGRGEAPVAQMMDDLMDGENPYPGALCKRGRVLSACHGEGGGRTAGRRNVCPLSLRKSGTGWENSSTA